MKPCPKHKGPSFPACTACSRYHRAVVSAGPMVELLACLTGYVEARYETDPAAPVRHAEDARKLLRYIETGEDH